MKRFKGVFTALTTPFIKGEIDFDSLKSILRQQLDAGIHGFVVNGTTAESPTLTEHEVESLFKFVQSEVSGQVPLILGTGSNSTARTVHLTQRAEQLGAQAALVVVPYYNKPSQMGLRKHFEEVAKKSEIPLLLYNVPSRTITRIEEATIRDLAQSENIVGIKEASGDLAFDEKLIKGLASDFVVLSGDDGTFYEFMLKGGDGIISVCSHLIPKEMVKWYQASAKGSAEFIEEFYSYKELIDSLYVEANPIPLKYALEKMQLIASSELRLPLTSLDESLHEKNLKHLQAKGLLP